MGGLSDVESPSSGLEGKEEDVDMTTALEGTEASLESGCVLQDKVRDLILTQTY